MGIAMTATNATRMNEPVSPCHTPARLSMLEVSLRMKSQPRELSTGHAVTIVVKSNVTRIASEASKARTSIDSRSRPRTSARRPRRAASTVERVGCGATIAISVHPPDAADEAFAHHVEGERDREQQEADEVEREEGVTRAADLVRPAPQRGAPAR